MQLTESQRLLTYAFLKQAIVAVLYLVSGAVIHQFFTQQGIVSIVWPATGLALGIVLIWGNAYLWGVTIGAFTLNYISNTSPWAICGMTLANVAEIGLASHLLKTLIGRINETASLKQYLQITLRGGIACVLAAYLGSTSLFLAGYISASEIPEQGWYWWRGDFLGIVVFSPLILGVRQHWLRKSDRRSFVEALILLFTTWIFGQIVFLEWGSPYFRETPKGYLMFFFINLIALRSTLLTTSIAIVTIAIQGLAGAILKIGFFGDDIDVAQFDNYWMYMVIISLVGITISTYVAELRNARNEAICSKG